MTFSQLFLVLHARRKIILYTLLATILAVLVVSLLLPKSYKATTTLVLNYKGIDPVTGIALPGQLTPSYMATQVGVITSKSVAMKAVQELKLADDPAYQKKFMNETDGEGNIEDWLAARLLKKLDVVPAREGNVVDISFSGASPQFAAAVANAFANAVQNTNIELKVEPVKKASLYFNEQIKALRSNLESAQNRLSKYQQEKGIASAESRYDLETLRLNELSTQLVTVQNQLTDAMSRQHQAEGKTPGESPDVLASPLIQNLRASLAQAEAKRAQVAERFTPDHPAYQESSAEVRKLRAELAANIKAVSNGVGNSARILQQREAELSAALAAQKAKVLELNRGRDQLSVLSKEVESAQHAYDSATQRVAQTNLEGHFNQSEVAVLNQALPPFTHSSPKLSLNLAAATLAGLLLGIGFALLAEMTDRRVRSASDLADTLQAPVLGAIDWGRSERRRPALSKWLAPLPLRLN